MSIFTQVPAKRPRTNTFDLSHDRKFSCPFGMIVPTLAMECVPGDSFKMNCASLVRMPPLIAPIMDTVSVYNHTFFVPNRLVWKNFEQWQTGGEDGQDTTVFPTITPPTSQGIMSIWDFFGLPIDQNTNPTVSAIPFAAYQLIWNEYFRDQNLQTGTTDFPDPQLVDGDNSSNTALWSRRFRARQHDYFTASLPWTQKGPEATIPLGNTAPLVNFGNSQTMIREADGNTWGNTGQLSLSASVSNASSTEGGLRTDVGGGSFRTSQADITDHTQVDLSGATAATINELRQAYRLQEWLEKNARGGTRYSESILSHFGVRSPDARLNRPEFLGGSQNPISVSEVLQTSGSGTTGQTTPQANMSGHGIAAGAGSNYSYYCKEHGYIISVMTIRPKTSYYQGIPKHFQKFDRFDTFWPSFANLGEQPVYSREIYYDGNDGPDNDEIWGYVPRYAEYKYIPSSVHGEFRTSLDIWHLGLKLASRPALNSAFIQQSPADVARVFAVTGTESQAYVHLHHRIKARRPMPYFGRPTT